MMEANIKPVAGSQDTFAHKVAALVSRMEKSQYETRNHQVLIPDVPVLNRLDLRKLPVNPTGLTSTTSGSTGIPVTVQKTMAQLVWFKATNQRELLWRKWDVSRNLAVITARVKAEGVGPWTNNLLVFPNATGRIYAHPLKGDLQAWLNSVPCDYLHSYPSIIQSLDTSRLLDFKSTGERGGSMYSSEEVGTIAIECPDNPDVYHVMENIIVELDADNNILVTDLTHPYLKRYQIGDRGEWARCTCGRTLQTLKKKVLGRIRNMAVAPDGSRFWPTFGSIKFNAVAPNLVRCQCVQESLTQMTLKVEGKITPEEEHNILHVMRESLGSDYECRIQRVEGFPEGKFEEFVCRI